MTTPQQRSQQVGIAIGRMKDIVATRGVNRDGLAEVLALVDGLAAHPEWSTRTAYDLEKGTCETMSIGVQTRR